MSLLDWNCQLKLGHAQIDSDHKKMVELLNRFHDASRTEHSHRICSLILSDLIAYTKAHFALEEQLMAISQYEQLAVHKAEHAALLKDIVELKTRLDRETAELDQELFDFLRHWVSSHIQGADRTLVAALQADLQAQAG